MKITRLLVLLFFGLLSSPVSQACTCVPANVQKDIERATVVFRGKLVAHSWGSAVFEVEEQFKGAATKKMKIEWRRGDRGNCNGFWPDDLVVGNELVVFAVLYRGVYRTSICLPTGGVAKAGKVLEELKTIKNR